MGYFFQTCFLCILTIHLQGIDADIDEIIPTQNYTYKTELMKNTYFLFWDVNTTDITFEVHVRTYGYIGFGISETGKMFPADVVVGWVKDGTVHFKDRHTIGHSTPLIDQSQDWLLLHGAENGFGTILKFTRNLATCDGNDTKIEDGTVRLIFSYNPTDPDSDDNIPYHGGARRGSRSISLLSPSVVPDKKKSEETKSIDFLNNNYMIPAVDTMYHCTTFQLPNIGKHHIVKYEPIITPGNELHVHHILIYQCNFDVKKVGMSFDCYHHQDPDAPGCGNIFLGWAIGGKAFYFPENIGLSVGGPGEEPFFIMETHYDNPTIKSGIIDNSGIRLTITPNLRPIEAGMWTLGHDVTWRQIIPPHEPSFVSSSYCPEQFINLTLDQANLTEVKAFAAVQHAHLLGRGITTRHFRNGVELPPLADDPNYDFDFQEMRMLKKETPIRKGDSFIIDCKYDSSGRTKPTLGGLSTREEMCLVLLLYYPRTPVTKCMSTSNLDGFGADNRQRQQTLRSMNWADPSVRQHFKDVYSNSTVFHYAYGPQLQPHYTHAYYKEMPVQHPYIPPAPACSSH